MTRRIRASSVWGGSGMILVLLMLSGCANRTVQPLPERIQLFNAPAQQVMAATMAAMTDRGFVIVYGDHVLGDIRARYASRPEWHIEANVTDTGAERGSELRLKGRHGSAPVSPSDFDRLTTTIAERLGQGPLDSPSRPSTLTPAL